MKRCPYLLPAALLLILLGLSIWNSSAMTAQTDHLRQQLDQVDQLAQREDWNAARSALEESHVRWTACQTYLHIVTEHDAVDDAEAMYRRAAAFAETEEITEFRAEIADLRDQLRLLAEMERFSIKNIL